MERKVIIAGTLVSAPTYKYPEGISLPKPYVMISTKRLSGVEDFVQVLVPNSWGQILTVGQKICIHGSLTSASLTNSRGKRRLLLFVNADNIDKYTEDLDTVYDTLIVCKKPIVRETPLGRCVADVLFTESNNRGNIYVPAILWDKLAQSIGDKPCGTKVFVRGRIQSRAYTQQCADGNYTRTINELSVNYYKEVLEDESV